MSKDWVKSINQSVGIQRINNLGDYLELTDVSQLSPIDLYYESTRDILRVATPQFFNDYPTMGSLLLLQMISATENYFRDIFSLLIQICPIAQSKSSDSSIKLSSVLWYGSINVVRGAFENHSFAGKNVIMKVCKEYLNYTPKNNGPIIAIIDEYDKVCELRHSIVHSNMVLSGGNAVKLGINRNNKVTKIKIQYPQFQECAAICSNLVISFNTEMFEEMGKRWAVDWPKYGFCKEEHNKLFNKLWKIFYSQFDARNGSIVTPLSMVKCRNQIRAEFHVN